MNRIARYIPSLDRGSPPWWSWVIGLTGLCFGFTFGTWAPRQSPETPTVNETRALVDMLTSRARDEWEQRYGRGSTSTVKDGSARHATRE